jgi:hypothetical protein
MAQQLYYTSAATGLAGRAGFQFVAASPGADATVQQLVIPYLGYQPPASASPRPTPAQIAELPVAFSFASDEDTAILVQCRYLGADYSGRYGNFLGHAVVADSSELAGLHPIELWGSPLWAGSLADRPELPELADLPPGEDIDPNAVATWLPAPGGSHPHRLLAELVHATLASLDGHGGQVVLVADTAETVARWIAAVSFSLPPAKWWALSFVTYTAHPERSRQRLVGTTPDAVPGSDTHAQVFWLDRPAASAGAASAGTAVGRYPAALARCWRQGDLSGIDELNQLVTAMDPDAGIGREALVALVDLSHGEQLAGAEAGAVAGLLPQVEDRLPEPIWDGLAQHTDQAVSLPLALALHHSARRTGHDALAARAGGVALARAISDRRDRSRAAEIRLPADPDSTVVPALEAALPAAADLDDLTGLVRLARRFRLPVHPGPLRAGTARAVRASEPRGEQVEAAVATADGAVEQAAMLDGVVDGLAAAGSKLVARLLTDRLCDLLFDVLDRDWDTSPGVWAQVLTSYGRRHRDQRVEVTDHLTDLADRHLIPGGEAGERLGRIWKSGEPGIDECLDLVGGNGLLGPDRARQPAVLDLVQRALVAGDLGRGEAYTLALRVQQLLDGAAAAGHRVAPDAAAVVAAHRVASGDLRSGYAELARIRATASKPVYEAAKRYAELGFLQAPPADQAALLRQLPDNNLRRRLVQVLGRLPRLGAVGEERLAELAIHLWRKKRPEPDLTALAARIAGSTTSGGRLRAALAKRDPELVTDLARMCAIQPSDPPPRASSFFGRRRGR